MLPSTESTVPANGELGNSVYEQLRPGLITCPWIREAIYANTFHIRLKLLSQFATKSSIGPLDLVTWSRYYGERSSKFTLNEFGSYSLPDGHNKEADGYVGYYHFCNGIDYSEGEKSIERYVAGSIGLVWSDNTYFRGPRCLISLSGCSLDKPMILSLCAYNLFSRAELRARFLIVAPKGTNPSMRRFKLRKFDSPVEVRAQYSVYFAAEQRMVEYSAHSIQNIESFFWLELAALSLIRSVHSADDPSLQLCGTVNLPDMLLDLQKLNNSIRILIKLLPKGHISGTRDAYGSTTLAGLGTGLLLKLTTYRNYLLDTLIRIVLLDISGSAADSAIALILLLYQHNFDYVICQLLKTQHTKNNTPAFMALLHEYFSLDSLLCQAALLLIEQCRFLIGQGSTTNAKYVAVRAVAILPLDFDSWYHLALCYILEQDFVRALDTINSLCVVLASRDPTPFDVNNVLDTYAFRWSEHSQNGSCIDLRTFERFFPPPVNSENLEMASMQQIWHKLFQYDLHTRKPILGVFYTSPLDLATPKEACAVGYEVQEVMSTNSVKLQTAAKSANQNRACVLDYERRSTWGRVYDLLTMIFALIGWEDLQETRKRAFTENLEQPTDYIVDNLHGNNHKKFVKRPINNWLLQLLAVIYNDLHAMTSLNSHEHRSALAWEMIGFVGWGSKYNLRETISALITSASSASEGRLDYFATVKLLEIHNEFLLSEVTSLGIDNYKDIYKGSNYTNKLIVKFFSPQVYDEFVRLLEMNHFTLENLLLHSIKLTSYSVRWYGYLPLSLVYDTLVRLGVKYEVAVVRETLRILFIKLREGKQKHGGAFTFKEMFAPPNVQDVAIYEFEEGDTIESYFNSLLDWIQSHDQTKLQ